MTVCSIGKRLNGSRCGNFEFKTYPLNPTYGINHLCAVVESFEEKTEIGSIELSKLQYNERSKYNAQNTVRISEREISKTANFDGGPERNDTGTADGNRNPGRNAAVFGQAVREELRNDTGRSLHSSSGNNRGTAIDSDDVQHQERTHKEEQSLDTDGGDAVQYQQRIPHKSNYKNISQQEYRQIQEDRMERYGVRFDEMPVIDYTHAHDLLYVFENFDGTSFGVLERIDPAKNKAKADIYVEAFNNGPIQDYQDLSGRVARLRNFQKLRSVYRSDAGNGRSGTGNAGLGTGSGGSANGTGMHGTGCENQAQNQQRTHALTDREVLAEAVRQVKADVSRTPA